MMQFPKVTGPAMPKKKKAKTGIGGAIGGVIEKLRAKGRPAMSDSVPGAPQIMRVEDEDKPPRFSQAQKDRARAKGMGRAPLTRRSKYNFGRGGGT